MCQSPLIAHRTRRIRPANPLNNALNFWSNRCRLTANQKASKCKTQTKDFDSLHLKNAFSSMIPLIFYAQLMLSFIANILVCALQELFIELHGLLLVACFLRKRGNISYNNVIIGRQLVELKQDF